jgi:hypothetical protein
LTFARKVKEIAAEAALDGLYVVRTSLPPETLDDAGTVRAYKSLAQVERAFRCLKTVDLQVRPIYHWLADRARPRLPLRARLPNAHLGADPVKAAAEYVSGAIFTSIAGEDAKKAVLSQ